MTALMDHPTPRPPASRVYYVDELTEVTSELAHRVLRRSSQELATALLEVADAAVAVKVFCPLGDVQLEPEQQARADAARLRLDTAVIRAVAADASVADIDAATKGVDR